MLSSPPSSSPLSVRVNRRPRFGRGQISIPVILAVVIALFGVVRYFTSSQNNPVTGEAQRVALTPEQEVALGVASAPKMAAKMGGVLPASDDRVQLVRRVGEKLVAQIGVKHPWRFQFHVLSDPRTVNAFALPGGQCFITVALLERLENEAQLAGVMGHEIGHVIERHSAERIAKGELGRSIVSAVGVGASGSDGGNLAYYAASVADNMIQMSYGRDAELESDRYGVDYMAKAGYDPREMVGVMKILKAATGGSRQPEFASTHPDPGNRAEQITAIVQKLFPQGVPANLSKGATLAKGRPSGLSLPKVKW